MRRTSIIGAAAGVLLLAGSATAATISWSVQPTPNPAGGSDSGFAGMACASAKDCAAVGSYDNGKRGVTLAERWNGRKWSIQPTPNPRGGSDNILYSVSCAPAARRGPRSPCTAVGRHHGRTNVTLAERWNGATWSIQPTPNPFHGSDIALVSVSCPSTSTCIAVGDYHRRTTYVPLAERWNGRKWSIQRSRNPTGASDTFLSGVSCASASDCTAVGDYYDGTRTVTLAERWNGTKWWVQHTPNPTGTSDNELEAVWCRPATRRGARSACTAVGYKGNGNGAETLAERFNGTKWSIQPTPNPSGGSYITLDGVSCVSPRACTAVGSYFGTTTPIMSLAERFNGAKWSIEPTVNPASYNFLEGVWCATATVCTAAGYDSDDTTSVTLVERSKRSG